MGRIEGRITAPELKATRGLTIHAESRLDVSDPAGVVGSGECITTTDGRFIIPAIAEGTVTLKFVPHLGLPFRGRFEKKPEVAPGQSTRVDLTLKRTMQVKLARGLTEPDQRLAALTHMARSLAKHDPARAEELLNAVYAAHEKMVQGREAQTGRRPRRWCRPASTASVA